MADGFLRIECLLEREQRICFGSGIILVTSGRQHSINELAEQTMFVMFSSYLYYFHTIFLSFPLPFERRVAIYISFPGGCMRKWLQFMFSKYY